MKRLFCIIWKINAIFIFLLGALLIVISVYSLLSTWGLAERFNNTGAVPVTAKTPAKEDEPVLSINTVDEIPGLGIVRCSILSGSSEGRKISGSFSSGYSSNATCNYLFYDTLTNQQFLLFPTNNNVVVESTDFYFPAYPAEKRVAKWTSYVVADKDTNGDGLISSSDLQYLAVAQADGKNIHTYLSDLTRVLKTELVGENDLCAFYEQNKSIFVSRLDLAHQKVISTQKIF